MNFDAGIVLKDRYEIKRLLGKGGMGAVYLAHDRTLKADTALKVNHSTGEKSSAQFMQEARLLARLRHSNLPRVIDYFVIDQNEFLVMDLIEGEDLDIIILNEGRLPLEKVLKWARQIGSALEYMHEQTPQVIHRDIKPANVKLTAGGDAMLVDFGIAKAADTAQATSSGALAYTPGYAPPEQYSHQRTGPYSDQYSLAATLYTLLSAVQPADSVERVLGTAQLIPLKTLVEDIPDYVAAAIDRALSIHPGERYVNVSEFIKALTHPGFIPTPPAHIPAAEDNTIAAPPLPPDWAERPQEPAHSGLPRWLIPTVVILGLLVLAGIGGGVIFTLSKRAPQSTPTPSELQIAQKAQQTTVAYLSETPTPTNTPTPSHTPLPTNTPPFTATPTSTPTNTYTPTATSTLSPIGGSSVIAFSSDRGGDNTLQIWIMFVGENVNGNPAVNSFQQLTFGDGDKQHPVWSPDGTRLLYTAPAAKAENAIDIWMLDMESPGSAPVDLSQQPGDETEPTWSPDGTIIAFNYSKPESDIRLIYAMNPDGTGFRPISYEFETFSEFSPVFSPDMQYLLHVTDNLNSLQLIFRKQWEDYGQRTPFDLKSGGTMGEVIEPDWSPENDILLYTKIDGEERTIYSAPFLKQGEETKLLTSRNTAEGQADWSPDTEWIAFTSERDGNPEIYIMTSRGGIQTNLSNHEGRDLQPDWKIH